MSFALCFPYPSAAASSSGTFFFVEKISTMSCSFLGENDRYDKITQTKILLKRTEDIYFNTNSKPYDEFIGAIQFG